MFNLSKEELKIFKKLSSPIKIQDFLDKLAINFEKKGETYTSPRQTLKTKKAHCLEGALLAGVAFWLHGQEPLLLDLKTTNDDKDHVVALYKINGYWGAVSKTNHAVLRFRDPVYKTIRELALSYFHEYFLNKNGKKTLRSYSRPFNLKTLGKEWVTTEKDLYSIAEKIDRIKHFPIFPKKNERFLRKANIIERQAGNLTEWKKRDKRT